ncbi:type I DNA topoisomerase [Prevotella histicola]|jgi:DNA topoisomerase I|uniref:type I DNA topoisomerase n=1 Tax=Prevotella histicola TaxID=470565 RepID=UPI001C5F326E|nr:type I DNA topoisomerase [Prevotella histicola]MBF1391026.1 type I DNA topoisomerase [Prevotella histicola]MBF1397990.1 type I DNA topoisomerase [Prevotella histicola]MBF1409239.1 type I DNA topoisomerase [Prevotella histicola]MBF1410971.1 type I DNA topoisomerase [Prevotella histicola]MBF1424209.1 type I DNA topoisomerase [Prevotella histicola]
MQENLVIVESPAKAKTIEKFLGKDYKVMSSYGHIRDLKKKELSIDLDTLNPDYEIPEEKKKVVSELKKNAKAAKKIWLASDEDREGEAISWHLCEVLGLDEANTNRIVFHEITKPAILKAIETPRHLDMNLVNAQQARRVLDRLVGFRLSPVLWRKVKPALSAGRVQSVAVRLIVEREREIQNFVSEPYYRVNAVFAVTSDDGAKNEVKAELSNRFKTHEEALAFLEECKKSKFTVSSITKKPLKRTPAPPFTTSTLQQEAARKLGFTVSQTMMVAQRLYEAGRITYMRTDSVNLSSLAINTSKDEIVRLYGEEYSKVRMYHTHSKGAQEAHEAIRPTYIDNVSIEGTSQEKRLYDLIWKRTIASQMADAQIEKTTVNIAMESEDGKTTNDLQFIANGEVVAFEGFLKVYHESTDDEDAGEEFSHALPVMHEGEELERREIVSTERYSQSPNRYTEASLVRKLEELGIGRPSTYAPTISTIQQRDYVHKGDRKGEERKYAVDSLLGLKITSKTKKEMAGADKGKLIPTDIGMVVNDFLMENFPEIMDYNFTAKVEQEFDKIAEGKAEWNKEMKVFYQGFEPEVEKVMNARSEHKAGERELGIDPATGKPVFVKIGRFGPVVQIGTADDEDKPRFSQLPSDKSMETITLDEALELFKLPRTVGQFEGTDVVIGAGRFGPYVLHNKKYVSLPKDENPMTITLDAAINLIQKKRLQEAQRHLKTFEEDANMEVMNGRYGPYIAYNGKNYRMPKALHEKASELTYEQCMDIVNNAPEPKRKK